MSALIEFAFFRGLSEEQAESIIPLTAVAHEEFGTDDIIIFRR